MNRKEEIQLELLRIREQVTKSLHQELQEIVDKEKKEKFSEELVELAKNNSKVIFTATKDEEYFIFIGRLDLIGKGLRFEGVKVEYHITDEEYGRDCVIDDFYETGLYDFDDLNRITLISASDWRYTEFKNVLNRVYKYLV